MKMNSFDFGEQLTMSQGVSASKDVTEILLENIPGSVNVLQAAQENDRRGIDWWIEMNTARHLAVDAKVRDIDWAATHPDEDDIALESWSVIEKKIVGWTRDTQKQCDYVLWLWKPTGRFCILPFAMLCKVFIENWEAWRDKYKTKQQHTKRSDGGYHSECIFVPRRIVWAEIYKTFSGQVT